MALKKRDKESSGNEENYEILEHLSRFLLEMPRSLFPIILKFLSLFPGKICYPERLEEIKIRAIFCSSNLEVYNEA